VEPLALPIRARFVPLSGRPACSSDWCMPRIPGGRFVRRSARAGRQAGLVRARGRGGQPDQPAPSHRVCTEAVPECAPPAAKWKTGTVPWRATPRAVWTLHQRRHHVARVPGVPSQGLDLVETFIYLSWTDDVPIVYPPCTCATGNVQDECLTLMGVHVGGPTRPIAPYRAISYSAEVSIWEDSVPGYSSRC